MPASSDFFGHRSAQAVLKHGVLTRYAHYFAGPAGSATRGRVAFIDGYAGEGRYEDGSPGSPLLLASQATRAQLFEREVKLAFVERDDRRYFSLSTVARMGRTSVVDGPTSRHNAEQLDSALGPIGWRDDFARSTAPNGPTEAALVVARRFGESVRRATGSQSTGVPVRQRPGQLPKYLLMLFSADQKAHWDFADQASNAYVDWLYHCDREDYEANVRFREEQGLLELFAVREPKCGTSMTSSAAMLGRTYPTTSRMCFDVVGLSDLWIPSRTSTETCWAGPASLTYVER